jgi:regulator of sigma E protease
VASHQNDSLEIIYERDGTSIVTELLPAAGFSQDKKIVGISSTLLGTLKMPIDKAFISGAVATYEFTKLTFVGFYDLFAKLIKGEGKEAAKSLTGPVGIVGLVGEAKSSGLAAILAFTALISINLAVLNILPLPALDGGRIVFVMIESIIRRPISFKTQNLVNGISFALLLVLMVVVTYRDIIKLF